MEIHSTAGINYDRWKRIVIITQIWVVVLIFITELVGNTLLYITRSQGYGPDTIVEKLLRYLILTTVINVGTLLIGRRIVYTTANPIIQKYTLIVSTSLICIDVTYSHYQFSICFAIFAIPIILSILYEDLKLTNTAFGLTMVGLLIGVIARGSDSGYNTDIGPEAAISITLMTAVFIFSRVILRTLEARRLELNRLVVEAEKSRYLERVESISVQTLSMLAQTIDAKDRYTNGHSFRVSEYAVILGRALGLDEEELNTLRQEALLHDIGKIGVPDSILNKRGRLTDVEFKVMKSHTALGEDILKNMIMLPDADSVAGQHHERYDGKGYPKGLAGEAIFSHARIVGICDAYDAMSSDRVYRKALSKDAIREQLTGGRGTQFDPDYLDVFLRLFEADELTISDASFSVFAGLDENLTDIHEDLKSFLEHLETENESEEKGGPLLVGRPEFGRIYEYLKQMEQRYGHHFIPVQIEITEHEDALVTESDRRDAASAMESAIRQNIRSVDLYMSYGQYQHLVVLMNPGDNVDMIIQRTFLDFYKLFDTTKFELAYECR